MMQMTDKHQRILETTVGGRLSNQCHQQVLGTAQQRCFWTTPRRAATAAGGWSTRTCSAACVCVSAALNNLFICRKIWKFLCLFNNLLMFRFCLYDAAWWKIDDLCCGFERFLEYCTTAFTFSLVHALCLTWDMLDEGKLCALDFEQVGILVVRRAADFCKSLVCQLDSHWFTTGLKCPKV